MFDFLLGKKLVLLNCQSTNIALDILTTKISLFPLDNCQYFSFNLQNNMYIFVVRFVLDLNRECIICSIFSIQFEKMLIHPSLIEV